jgi:hypothetical protein
MNFDPIISRVAARFAVGHQQTLVKVNTPVDEGISEVVSALSQLPVITVSSCEGNDKDHEAIVQFRHADSDIVSEGSEAEARHRAADFFVWLTQQINKRMPFERSDHPRLITECYGHERLQFTLTWDNRTTSELAKVLREIGSGR